MISVRGGFALLRALKSSWVCADVDVNLSFRTAAVVLSRNRMDHNNLSTDLFSVSCSGLKNLFVQQHNNQQADDFDPLTLRGT